MKKIASMLMALSMSLGSMAFAEGQAPDRDFAPDANPNVTPPPGAVQDPGGARPPPTFEQWVERGKQIPPGMVFTGGSPIFDESTGKNRSDEEVYKIIFPERPEKPDPVEEYRNLEERLAEKKAWSANAERDLKDKIAKAKENPPPGWDENEVAIHVKNLVAEHEESKREHAAGTKHLEDRLAELKAELPQPEVEKPDPVEEYRRVEKLLEGSKAWSAKAERDLEDEIAELRKNPDQNEVEAGIKKARSEHEESKREHAAGTKHLEDRLAELKEIPEVAICIFPPRPEPRPFPPHWGHPPAIQTKDLRQLPEGFEGMGSSTLCAWIERNIKADHEKGDKPKPEPKRPPIVLDAKPPRPELPEEVESDKKALMEEMKAKLASLEGASREDTRKAVEEFKEDNEARFATIKKAADAQKELERPERKERPAPPPTVKTKIEEVKKVEKTLHVARKTVRDELKKAQDELAAEIAKAKENPPPGWDENEVAIHVKNLVAEQAAARKAALDAFKKDQRLKHEALKAAQKELREEVRNTKEKGESRTSR